MTVPELLREKAEGYRLNAYHQAEQVVPRRRLRRRPCRHEVQRDIFAAIACVLLEVADVLDPEGEVELVPGPDGDRA